MVKCPHAAAGCNYPEGDCPGHCLVDNGLRQHRSEALRLADSYEATGLSGHIKAAAELRRLHALNHELLEALSGLVGCIDHGSQNPTQKLEVARTAIAKATGETK